MSLVFKYTVLVSSVRGRWRIHMGPRSVEILSLKRKERKDLTQTSDRRSVGRPGGSLSGEESSFRWVTHRVVT